VSATCGDQQEAATATLLARVQEKFPVLYLVACSSLGAVASSTASERDFSTAGAVMRKNRTRLLPQHLEMHCFIHDNVDLLPTPIEAVPTMTNEQANKVRASMPMAGRQQDLEGDINTSADEECSGEPARVVCLFLMFVNAGRRVFHRGESVRMSRVCEDGTAARSNA